jgi:hypothetical protein
MKLMEPLAFVWPFLWLSSSLSVPDLTFFGIGFPFQLPLFLQRVSTILCRFIYSFLPQAMASTTASNAAFVDNHDNDVPEEFLCPLTLEIFHRPLMSRHGQRYESHAILSWISRGNQHCPLTRQPLTMSGLIRDRNLEHKIRQWKEDRGIDVTPAAAAETVGNGQEEEHIRKSLAFVHLEGGGILPKEFVVDIRVIRNSTEGSATAASHARLLKRAY